MKSDDIDECDGCGGDPIFRADVGDGYVCLCAGCRDIVRSILVDPDQ
jgi:hypothetical protein